jgi:hypothetical protein
MTSASTADTWRETAARRERRSAPRPVRSEAAPGATPLPRPPVPPPAPRMRSTDIPPLPEHLVRAGRRQADDQLSSTRPPRTPVPPRPEALRPAAARPAERSRPAGQDGPLEHDLAVEHGRPGEQSRPVEYDRRVDQLDRDHADGRRRAARPADARAAGRRLPEPERGSRLRGWAAVAAVLVVTFAGAAADIYLGAGLGLPTLVVLTGSSALATLLVRRRDLWTTVVAPPLVFIVAGVAATTVLASFSLTAVAAMVIRGFPAMAIATGTCLALALVRWAARR